MARGFAFVERAASETRTGSGALWGGKLRFILPQDGDSAMVRFVPDEDGEFIYGAWHHEIPVEGRAWGDQVPCIAQDEDGNRTEDPCPGCEADLKMKFRGFVLVIWYDGPVYKTNDEGRLVKDNMGAYVITGHKDQVAIWQSGPRLFENLAEIDDSYGLDSRVFRIKRKGLNKDTTYSVMPADVDGGRKAMTAADKKLVKEGGFDLSPFIKPPSYEDWTLRLTGTTVGVAANGGDSEASSPATEAQERNPFRRGD